MNRVFAILLFLVNGLHSVEVFAQERMDIDDSFVIELGLPNGFINKPFKDIMQGLVYVAPMYQYTFKNGLSLGAGAHYSYFNVNQFRINQDVYGGMHSGAVFVKFGYERFWTPSLATDLSIKAGFVQTAFSTDTLKKLGYTYQARVSNYLEPNIGICLASDVNASFRLSLGYAFYGFGFRPFNLGVASDLGYSASEFNKVCSFLIVGFGYSRYFNGKKSANTGWDED